MIGLNRDPITRRTKLAALAAGLCRGFSGHSPRGDGSRSCQGRNRVAETHDGGVLDNNSGLYEVRLGHNRSSSLPTGFSDNNPILVQLDLNDNAISSLNGVGLAGLHELLIFRLHNNQLTQLPSADVTEFVEDANETILIAWKVRRSATCRAAHRIRNGFRSETTISRSD